MTDTWIHVKEKFPEKERYYRCLCLYFNKPIKCKFKKGKNGPREWSSDHFIYRKRVPYVVYWKDKEKI